MEEFDYLNDTLINWVDEFSPEAEPGQARDFVSFEEIQNEYLPRFEAAIWRKSAGK